MNTISTNPTMAFQMPTSGVNVNATFELIPSPDSYFNITSNGVISASAELGALPVGSVDLVIPSVINGIQVKSTSASAFHSYKSLRSVVIPNSVTSIGMRTFMNCTNLISINIPNSISFLASIISMATFGGCTALTSINIDKPKDSLSGAPWGAINATVNWLG